jgi:hypothetical protein
MGRKKENKHASNVNYALLVSRRDLRGQFWNVTDM